MIELKDFTELTPNNLIEDLVAYIYKELSNFTSSSEFTDILVKKKNENQHSTAFCVFMTNKCLSKFCFQRENAQKGSSVIDIGVYFGSNLIFTIEAKLLPTPTGTKKKPRTDHEYVYGQGAGIERFKSEKHGYDNTDNSLNENAMIGYITENNFDFWLEKVNNWIIEANWDEREKLEQVLISTVISLKSVHKRRNNIDVTLHHFWVKVA